MIFNYKVNPYESVIATRSNSSNSKLEDTNFITRTLENKAKMDIKNIRNDALKILPHHDFFVTSLAFYVDADFDQNERKWFWSDGNEITADHWFYHCSIHPHQPATDLTVTITEEGILRYKSKKKLYIELKLFVVILKCFDNFTAGCINANNSTKSSPILYLESVDRCSSNGELLKQIDKNGYCVSCCASRKGENLNT